MNKQIALAYAVAGIAVAVALIATVGGRDTSSVPEVQGYPPNPGAESAASEPEPLTPSEGGNLDPAAPAADVVGAEEPAPEYVYVDAPARTGRHHDHEDDEDDDDDDGEDEHEEHERRGSRGHERE